MNDPRRFHRGRRVALYAWLALSIATAVSWAQSTPSQRDVAAVRWRGAADEPSRDDLARAQRAAGEAVWRCFTSSVWASTEQQRFPIEVTFAPDGTVARTSMDHVGPPGPRCLAAAVRRHMRVRPFAATAPVRVQFPLGQTRWSTRPPPF